MNKYSITTIKISISLCALFSVILLCAGCNEPALLSSWSREKVKIDGKYSDWNKLTTYYFDRQRITLSIVNDENYLYLCLISRNRRIETKIMDSGLVVWFDPDNKQKKAFGIKFPIGLRSIGASLLDDEKRRIDTDWRDQQDTGGLIDRDKDRLLDKSFNERLEELEKLQEKLVILDSDYLNYKNKRPKHHKGKDAKSEDSSKKEDKKREPPELTSEETGKLGIEARVGRENGYFIYELKVPLVKSAEHPNAIGAIQGKSIGVGFMIEENPVDSPFFPDTDEAAPKRRESMLGSEDSLKIWVTIELASRMPGKI
jgi:hypothetical protein